MTDYKENQYDQISYTLGNMLGKFGLTLSIAESCSGGLISHRITQIPGSSNYFKGGVIAYSNEIKVKILGVHDTVIEKYGAVSAQVANQMAKGALEKFETDISCSVTGIAGPEGGTENKPVGLVYIAVESKSNAVCERFLFSGSRQEIKYQTSTEALNLIYKFVTDNYVK